MFVFYVFIVLTILYAAVGCVIGVGSYRLSRIERNWSFLGSMTLLLIAIMLVMYVTWHLILPNL